MVGSFLEGIFQLPDRWTSLSFFRCCCKLFQFLLNKLNKKNNCHPTFCRILFRRRAHRLSWRTVKSVMRSDDFNPGVCVPTLSPIWKKFVVLYLADLQYVKGEKEMSKIQLIKELLLDIYCFIRLKIINVYYSQFTTTTKIKKVFFVLFFVETSLFIIILLLLLLFQRKKASFFLFSTRFQCGFFIPIYVL